MSCHTKKRANLVSLAGVPERPGGASRFGGIVQRESRVELRRNLLQPLVVGWELSEHAERVALELCPQLLRDRGAANAQCSTRRNTRHVRERYKVGRWVRKERHREKGVGGVSEKYL